MVDIQGVGDLYTDPQIHTEKGTDFGDGNLGRWGKPAHFCGDRSPSTPPKSPSSLDTQGNQMRWQVGLSKMVGMEAWDT